MLKRLYDWTLSMAQHPRALWVLAFVAFVESSVFPIPPDILMIPLIVARPKSAFKIALVATLASVAGGMLGYYIGFGAFETIGKPVLEFYGKDAYFDEFAIKYNEWGAWAVLIAGVTPFPYKVITILSGATALSLPVFIAASITARALRFFIVAALLWKFGEPIRTFIEKRLGFVFIAFIVILLGGFYAVKFV
jgi:membrane protein YqaA with SNARE-associated domain